MADSALIDGRPGTSIPLDDRGLLYGDGLFETLRVVSGDVPLWPWHWRRLSNSCQALDLSCPEPELLLSEITSIAGADPTVVRVTLTRGSGTGYAAPPSPVCRRIVQRIGPAPTTATEPIVTMICKTRLGEQTALAGLKHLARLEQVLAASEVAVRGFDEGLVMDLRDHVIEGTRCNLFGVTRGRLTTPDLSRCGVGGVYRQFLIDSLGADIVDMPLNDLENYDALFFCNAIRGIMPVLKVDTIGEFSIDICRQIQRAVPST